MTGEDEEDSLVTTPAAPPADKKRKLGSEATAPKPPDVSASVTPRGQGQIQFAVFCLKRKDSVLAEHPGFTDEEVEIPAAIKKRRFFDV